MDISAFEPRPVVSRIQRDLTPAPAEGTFQPFGGDGPTFLDLLDVINPLQHVPIVGPLYRQITGDEIDPAPRLAGGALFGGVFGAVGAFIDVIVEELTGNDIGDHALAFLGIIDDDPAIAVAEAPVADVEPAAVSDAFAEVTDWARAEMRHMDELAALQGAARYREAAELPAVRPTPGLLVDG